MLTSRSNWPNHLSAGLIELGWFVAAMTTTCGSGPLLCMAGYESLLEIGCVRLEIKKERRKHVNSVHIIPEMLIYHYNLTNLSL